MDVENAFKVVMSRYYPKVVDVSYYLKAVTAAPPAVTAAATVLIMKGIGTIGEVPEDRD
jgi:hypothetical protein